ncbi:MAG: hypothetical protein K8R99_13645 [Actinomycetia bacterium]|nr:hypothetical protein [Actinomycetes bacterium]
MSHTLFTRTATTIVGLALLAAACSSSKTSSATGVPTSESVASSTTVDTTPTTSAATTTPPTTVPAPIDFTLHGDGIGPFNLGIPADELIDAMTTQFGPASSDDSAEYPTVDTFGGYTSADGEVGFVAPFGRTVCWSFQFCADFGGADAATQSFVGWTYNEPAGTTLSSTSGVTIGSRWSDFPAMVVDSGGCYTVGSGTIDGITLTLMSDVVAFGSYDDLGNYVVAVPPADQVAVTSMQIGDSPSFLFGDC